MSYFKRYFIFILMFLSLVLVSFLYISQNRLEVDRATFKKFKKESEALISLKEKWKQNRDYKKIFTRLRAIAKPKKDVVKGSMRIFEYENLSQITLERIIRILFNSGFVVKVLNIEKSDKKISLHVEVKI